MMFPVGLFGEHTKIILVFFVIFFNVFAIVDLEFAVELYGFCFYPRLCPADTLYIPYVGSSVIISSPSLQNIRIIRFIASSIRCLQMNFRVLTFRILHKSFLSLLSLDPGICLCPRMDFRLRQASRLLRCLPRTFVRFQSSYVLSYKISHFIELII